MSALQRQDDARPRCAGFAEFAADIRPALDLALAAELRRALGATRAAQLGTALDSLTLGKRTRGTLLCLIAAALGADLEDAVPRAVAVELIQAATLVHDDFVDAHRTRRGMPSLWTLVGARRAVLLGDVLFAHAIQMMSEQGTDDGRAVSAAIADTARGALAEPLDAAALADELESGRLDGSLYAAIVRLKTGALFGVACELAALAARVGADSRLRWQRYGLSVGEAYQVADDLHDVGRCLANRACNSSDLAALAPALLFFARDARVALACVARRGPPHLLDDLAPYLAVAHGAMKAEVEQRLAACAALIRHEPLPTGHARIVREAPAALIRMFDASSGSAL